MMKALSGATCICEWKATVMTVAFRRVKHAEKGKGGGIAHSLRKDLKNHPGTTPFASSCNPAFMLFMIDIIRK
jgi:hypothetical protein